jgi:uncharacterized repeat protein (TIGR01451 family)
VRRSFPTVLPVATFVLTLLLAAPAWAQADLDINKLDNPDPVDRGDFLVYTLEVTNEESTPLTPANNVQVIDNLPVSRVDFDSVDAGEFRCKFDGGTVRCELRNNETLGPGETEEIEIVVEAEDVGTAQNTAIVREGGQRADTDTESTRIVAANNNGGDGDPPPSDPNPPVAPAQDPVVEDPNATADPVNTASPAAEETDANLSADANRPDSGSFRCDLFLRVVRDDRGALQAQYRDDELIVQRFEQCLSEDVLADTIPNRNLPFTGGPLLPSGGGLLLLVAAAVLAGRIIRR